MKISSQIQFFDDDFAEIRAIFLPPILRQKLRIFRTFPKIRYVFRADFRCVFRDNFRDVFRGGFRGWFSGGRLARYPKLRDLSKQLGKNR